MYNKINCYAFNNIFGTNTSDGEHKSAFTTSEKGGFFVNLRDRLISVLIVTASLILAGLCYGAPAIYPDFPGTLSHLGALAFLIIAVGYLVLMVIRSRSAYDKNEEILSHLLKSVGAMVVTWNKDFECISVNNTFTELTGLELDDLKERGSIKRIIGGLGSRDRKNITKKDISVDITTKSGNVMQSVWNTSEIKSEGKKIYISVGMDTTKDHEMQKKLYSFSKELAETENRFTLSMELSEIGVMLKNSESDTLFISEQFQEMIGIEKDFVTVEELGELVHPNDRVVFDNYCMLDEDDVESCEKVSSIEIRILSSDKKYHWYLFRYKVSHHNGDVMVGGAILDITKDKTKDALIEEMAYIDEVTGINNRNRMMMIGQETYECSKGLDCSYWLVILDVDNFHIINDTCGYKNGNALLRSIAEVLRKNSEETGFVARIGGDNFAVLIRDTGDSSYPVDFIRKLQNEISGLAEGVFATQTITCSAGYCKMPEDAPAFDKAVDYAEFALSLSSGSRGTIMRYNRKMHDSIIAGNAIESELARALENNELVLYYQPKINLANGEIFGMEALIRWIKPNGQIVPPNMFIPVAEQSLLITKISNFVLREACRQNKEWQDKGLPKITVSVNLTSTDFYQSDVLEEMKSVLNDTGLEPGCLEIELTESLALKDIEQAVRQMNEIKKLGVKLAMDDFGTGYSSLSYIQVLPITLLKLDRSFVMYLEDDEVSREIVSAVIRIAKSKKIETIAEGIETQSQVDILKRSGCDHAQGFFFGKPMPADEFEKFVIEHTKQKVSG